MAEPFEAKSSAQRLAALVFPVLCNTLNIHDMKFPRIYPFFLFLIAFVLFAHAKPTGNGPAVCEEHVTHQPRSRPAEAYYHDSSVSSTNCPQDIIDVALVVPLPQIGAVICPGREYLVFLLIGSRPQSASLFIAPSDPLGPIGQSSSF